MSRQNKILICDDSLLIQMQLKKLLLDWDSSLILLEAQNGKEAVEVYKKEKPDLAFMDMVMPELNGVQCIQAIREFDKGAKIVILSSAGTKEVLKEALLAGALDFLQKPWRTELIVNLVEKNLGRGVTHV